MKSPVGCFVASLKMPRRNRREHSKQKQMQDTERIEEELDTDVAMMPLAGNNINSSSTSTTAACNASTVMGLSLISGSVTPGGQLLLFASGRSSSTTVDKSSNDLKNKHSSRGSLSTVSTCSMDDNSSFCGNTTACCSPPSSPTASSHCGDNSRFLRHSSSFLRVADLKLEVASNGDTESLVMGTCHSNTSMSVSSVMDDNTSMANFSYAAVDPPPGVAMDPDERWVALDDGAGSHAPVAPLAIQALAQAGLESTCHHSMWVPHSATKQFKAAPWHVQTWPSTTDAPDGHVIYSSVLPDHDDATVLLWTGKFQHGLYGSELPAVRSAGILPVAPKVLFDLLVDSTRVQEYNKLSLGREDLLILQDDLHNEGPFGKSITKVVKSTSQPPLLKKTMEFISILHAKELEDQSGYLCVTRAVTPPQQTLASSTCSSSSCVMRSEILMGVNLIRKVEGDPNRCLLINVTQIRSPMVPMMIANRIGATAAANFIKDLRAAVSA